MAMSTSGDQNDAYNTILLDQEEGASVVGIVLCPTKLRASAQHAAHVNNGGDHGSVSSSASCRKVGLLWNGALSKATSLQRHIPSQLRMIDPVSSKCSCLT